MAYHTSTGQRKVRSRGYLPVPKKPPFEVFRVGEPAPGWEIYVYGKCGGWLNFKIIHPEIQFGRSNFWLGYNWREDRFSNTSDRNYLLADSFPGARALLDATHAIFLEYRKTLTDMSTVEPTVEDLL